MMRSFAPIDNSTTSISASTSSARAAIVKQPTGRHQIRLHNAGAATVFVRLGGSSVEAATTNIPIPSGAIEVLTVNNTEKDPVTHVAAITSIGSATLYITTGEGI